MTRRRDCFLLCRVGPLFAAWMMFGSAQTSAADFAFRSEHHRCGEVTPEWQRLFEQFPD